MVHARAAAKNIQAAIRLCDNLCYNLRHSRGILDPVTVNMSTILATLYTNNGQFEDAVKVHHHILHEIEAVLRGDHLDMHAHGAKSGHNNKQNGSAIAARQTVTKEMAEMVSQQLELLMYAHLRCGDWKASS